MPDFKLVADFKPTGDDFELYLRAEWELSVPRLEVRPETTPTRSRRS